MRDALASRRQKRKSGISHLFFDYETGNPIKTFRTAWEGACRRAGHPEKLFHDFRRSAARNMIRAGISEHSAMKLMGHLTPSIFRRYAILDEQMLQDDGEKLSQSLGTTRPNSEGEASLRG